MHTRAVFLAVFLAASSIAAGRPSEKAIPPVPAGQAQIVFLRESKVAKTVATFIFETTSGAPEMVGIMPNERKRVLNLAPGDHVFMVDNRPHADFMRASVLAGKRYVVLVAANFSQGFSLRPIVLKGGEHEYRITSDRIQHMLRETTLAGHAAEKDENKALADARIDFKSKWPEWQSRTPEEQALLTLRPEDGQ
jgi:hypothetical protein